MSALMIIIIGLWVLALIASIVVLSACSLAGRGDQDDE